MPEITTQTPVPLFSADAASAAPVLTQTAPASFGTGGGFDMSQNEKDAIMRQIHPIFLTTHSEDKKPIAQSNFDKFLGFLRLCLEGLLKFVDIVVDAAIQIARLFVWIVAIAGVLIVVTLMTNTTEKFIDLLNSSVFPIIGLDTKIQKIDPAAVPQQPKTNTTPLESSTLPPAGSEDDTELTAAEKARLERIEARKRLQESAS